jgi:hypothetical protein
LANDRTVAVVAHAERRPAGVTVVRVEEFTFTQSPTGRLAITLYRLLRVPPARPARRRQDSRFDSTPLGLANHFRHQAMVELLTPLTTVR